MQMVGGENADNEEVKKKRRKRKEFADGRQLELASECNQNVYEWQSGLPISSQSVLFVKAFVC